MKRTRQQKLEKKRIPEEGNLAAPRERDARFCGTMYWRRRARQCSENFQKMVQGPVWMLIDGLDLLTVDCTHLQRSVLHQL